jgi:hypothetical protein
LKESSGDDIEMVDGYDDLPEDAKDKVRRALEQGHVDDEDWKGVSKTFTATKTLIVDMAYRTLR